MPQYYPTIREQPIRGELERVAESINNIGQGQFAIQKAVQTVFSSTASFSQTSGNIPYDDTIPQISEGREFLTATIVPQDPNNQLVIEAVMYTSSLAARYITIALFQDSTANALNASGFYSATVDALCPIYLHHKMTAGSTTSTTFSVRGGVNAAAEQVNLNGTGGARKYGGVLISYIKITEYKP